MKLEASSIRNQAGQAGQRQAMLTTGSRVWRNIAGESCVQKGLELSGSVRECVASSSHCSIVGQRARRAEWSQLRRGGPEKK